MYRIEVQDGHGTRKAGWVRIGGYWWPDPSRIEVRWDQPTPESREESEGAGRGNPLMWDRELDGP